MKRALASIVVALAPFEALAAGDAGPEVCRELPLMAARRAPDPRLRHPRVVDLDDRCGKGEAGACADLADLTQRGVGTPADGVRAQDLRRAADELRRGARGHGSEGSRAPWMPPCMAGDGDVCVGIALAACRDMLPGRERRSDEQEAARAVCARMAAATCLDGDARGCALLALPSRPDDAERLERGLTARCSAGELAVCDALVEYDLALRYAQRWRLSPAIDDALAVACRANVAQACWLRARWAGHEASLRRACRLGVREACVSALQGAREAEGLRGAGADGDLRELAEIVCAYDEPGRIGCELLVGDDDVSGPCKQWIDERLCHALRLADSGNPAACRRAARRVALGAEVPRDEERALELRMYACFADGVWWPKGPACRELAAGYEGWDDAFATELYAAACSVGDGPSCGTLGDRLLAGAGAPVDLARAEQARSRACSFGERSRCPARERSP